jgi:hypothetical protein
MLTDKFSGVVRVQRQWLGPSGDLRASEVEKTTHGDPELAAKIEARQVERLSQPPPLLVAPIRRVPRYHWLRWLFNLITKEQS